MKLIFLILPLFLQGCGLGVMMAGSGASKAGTARIMDSYNTYMIEMEKINIEREKAKLAPRPILTKKEWLKGNLGKEEVEPCDEDFDDCSDPKYQQ